MIQAGGCPAVNFMIPGSNFRYIQCDMAYIRSPTSGTHINMKYDSLCRMLIKLGQKHGALSQKGFFLFKDE